MERVCGSEPCTRLTGWAVIDLMETLPAAIAGERNNLTS